MAISREAYADNWDNFWVGWNEHNNTFGIDIFPDHIILRIYRREVETAFRQRSLALGNLLDSHEVDLEALRNDHELQIGLVMVEKDKEIQDIKAGWVPGDEVSNWEIMAEANSKYSRLFGELEEAGKSKIRVHNKEYASKKGSIDYEFLKAHVRAFDACVPTETRRGYLPLHLRNQPPILMASLEELERVRQQERKERK